MSPLDDEKRIAAEVAAALVEDGMRVGLGTGSTVGFLLPALAARGLRLRCVATSSQTERAARELGLAVEPFEGIDRLDIAIDGADQVDPARWLVKGGGAAHTREKIVAAAADRFVVIASSDKVVDALRPPVPLELLAYGLAATLRAVAPADLRDVPPSPDGGLIADHHGAIDDPAGLAARLDAVPGVVEHGLFPPQLVSDVLIGRGTAVERRVIRVCIAGVTGWTGRSVAAAVAEADDLELVAGVSRTAARERTTPGDGDVPLHHVAFASVAEALDAVPADVLVDYTAADAVRANVLAALDRGVAVVVGSSGLTAEDYEEVDARARAAGVGVIAAGNFSLLAALLLRSAAAIAHHVPAREILDYASAGKPDVPSGTARELAERLGAAGEAPLGRPLDSLLGPREARGATVAGTQVHSIRLPGFVVSTEVVFAATGERLTLRHDAGESPEPYVAGTLLAIRAVPGRVGLTRGLDSLLD